MSGLCFQALALDKTFLDAEFNPIADTTEAKYYRTVAHADPLFYTEVHFITNEMQMKGHYSDSSLTTLQGECSYYFKNGQLESQGLYEDGKRVGYWKRYTSDGIRKIDRYYFTANELATQAKKKNRLAKFRSDTQSWHEFVQENLEFPENAALLGYRNAKINVNLFIDASGQLSHFEILSCPHKSFYVETIELMGKMPTWNPAIKSGKCIASNYIVQVIFDSSLEREQN
ncbi:MAG: toxin-antitoxin system YwqK family antitoxin [Flavobacteriales bacterium]